VQILLERYVKEHDTLSFTFIFDFLTRFSEPLDLVRVNTPPTFGAKAVLMAGVQEPDPELHLLAIFIVDRDHIVESVGDTWGRGLSHAVLEATIQLRKLLSVKFPLAVMIPRSECPELPLLSQHLCQFAILRLRPPLRGLVPLVPRYHITGNRNQVRLFPLQDVS